MVRITVIRNIKAPVEVIFNTVSNIHNFAKAIPHIVKAEIISEITSGIGTRFRETRAFKGKEMTMEFEIIEYVENEKLRIVTDFDGTIWDTLYTVKPQKEETKLTVIMDAKSEKFFPEIRNRIMKGLYKKGLVADIDALKIHCENDCKI